MINLEKILGLNVCCGVKFIRNKFNNIITIINIGILYYLGLQIFNYSYNIGYNFTNSILYMDEYILAKAILEMYRLMTMLISICCWTALSQTLLEIVDCKCRV